MINETRLVHEFIRLASMESPSRDEGRISAYLKKLLGEFCHEIVEDDAHKLTGGEAGNLLGRVKGTCEERPAIFLNAHMDTVSPGREIIPVIRDGIVYSEGETILGSDDKSGIAIIIEVLRVLKEKSMPHVNLDILFTVCEEVGLLGAKFFDTSLLEAEFGYTLDSTSSCSIVMAAPAANHIKIRLFGKEAHAGLDPEHGINAIKLAAKALSAMPLGRIDEETTANIGIISGGKATNIVPERVEIEGEARSHDAKKLKRQTDLMVSAVKETVEEYNREAEPGLSARFEAKVTEDYPLMRLGNRNKSILLASKAAERSGIDAPLRTGGGGSDANIFNSKGLEVAIIGTGMDKVHTVNEQIKIEDMTNTARFLLEIIRENCEI